MDRERYVSVAETSVFVGQKLLQSGLQFRYSRESHVPNLIQVDTDVVMDQNIPHAANGFPISQSGHERQPTPASPLLR
jgi:hypothetical protein